MKVFETSFILHSLRLKCMYGWSIKSFNMLLQILGYVLPQISTFTSSWSDCKQLLMDLGLEYEKIHVCHNDYIIYLGERERQELCDKCGSSRWKNSEKKLPAMVLHYFPSFLDCLGLQIVQDS